MSKFDSSGFKVNKNSDLDKIYRIFKLYFDIEDKMDLNIIELSNIHQILLGHHLVDQTTANRQIATCIQIAHSTYNEGMGKLRRRYDLKRQQLDSLVKRISNRYQKTKGDHKAPTGPKKVTVKIKKLK